jgi:MATE family multidrug resistance protein
MAAARLPEWARPSEILDLTRLAVPVAMSRASFMLMSLTDAILLAWYAPGQLPLVLNGWVPSGVTMGFGMGLMLGVSVISAELSGQGRAEETGRILRRGLWVGALYGLLATVLVFAIAEPLVRGFGFSEELVAPIVATTQILALGTLGHMLAMACSMYLEALRKPNLVTAVSMSAVVLNAVVGLILVPEYGAVGVAWATTASRWYMMIVFLVLIAFTTPAYHASPKGPKGEFFRQNKVGIGTGIANAAEWGAFNLTFVIATLVSIDAGMIYGLTVQMMGVVFMIYVGMGTATSVRVAERFGRRDGLGVREASRLGVVASIAMGLVLAALLLLMRDVLAHWLLTGPESQASGESHSMSLMPTLALMLALTAGVTLFDGLQVVGAMGLRAQGVVWLPTIIHVGSYILLMLPLCVWFAFTPETAPSATNALSAFLFWPAHWPGAMGLGVWGVFIGISVASIAAGVGQVLSLEIKSRSAGRRASVEGVAIPVMAH